MKTGIFSVTALSLLTTLAAAQPHRHREHKRLHDEKRDVAVVTQVDWVTMTAPEVIVYVDQNGKPMYTSYANGQTPSTAVAVAPSSSAAASVVVASSAAATTSVNANVNVASAPSSAAVASSSAAAKASSAAPVASSAAASSAAAPVASSSSSNANSGHAITYSPYNADGTCKTQAQVNSDFTQISGYSMVRIYGVDCNQCVTVGSAAKAAGMKLFAGIYDITQVASSVATIVAAGNLDNIHTVSVGNELVNSGQASVAQVVAAIGSARTLLQAAGYKGKVVTVDTFSAILANPALCQASDYAAANAHAFFNSLTNAASAGTFVSGAAAAVSKACGGMDTIITETGWPSAGSANGAAVPGSADQATAIASIKAAMSNNVILFNAYNDLWKKDNSGTFGAEKYWGIYGTSTA